MTNYTCKTRSIQEMVDILAAGVVLRAVQAHAGCCKWQRRTPSRHPGRHGPGDHRRRTERRHRSACNISSGAAAGGGGGGGAQPAALAVGSFWSGGTAAGAGSNSVPAQGGSSAGATGVLPDQGTGGASIWSRGGAVDGGSNLVPIAARQLGRRGRNLARARAHQAARHPAGAGSSAGLTAGAATASLAGNHLAGGSSGEANGIMATPAGASQAAATVTSANPTGGASQASGASLDNFQAAGAGAGFASNTPGSASSDTSTSGQGQSRPAIEATQAQPEAKTQPQFAGVCPAGCSSCSLTHQCGTCGGMRCQVGESCQAGACVIHFGVCSPAQRLQGCHTCARANRCGDCGGWAYCATIGKVCNGVFCAAKQ